MKKFEIEATLEGYFVMEDSRCPSYWRGSGVYDVEVPCTVKIAADVWAETEERAEELLNEFDYRNDRLNPYDIHVEEVNITKCMEEDVADEDGDELIEVSYNDFWTPEYDRDYERED